MPRLTTSRKLPNMTLEGMDAFASFPFIITKEIRVCKTTIQTGNLIYVKIL